MKLTNKEIEQKIAEFMSSDLVEEFCKVMQDNSCVYHMSILAPDSEYGHFRINTPMDVSPNRYHHLAAVIANVITKAELPIEYQAQLLNRTIGMSKQYLIQQDPDLEISPLADTPSSLH